MKHLIYKLSALAMMLVVSTMTLASCNNDEPNVPSQKEIETNIVGNWKEMKRNGKDVCTNERQIWTYLGDGKGTNSISSYKSNEGKYIYANHKAIEYSLTDNKIHEKAVDMERYSFITFIDDSKMTATIDKLISNGVMAEKDDVVEYRKTSKDYSTEIIGTWEGVEMTGDETYGTADARIVYHADGTFTYYQKQDGAWIPSEDVSSEYNVDGDWLATRWRHEMGTEYNHEWWDIVYIKDGIMKWTALRERKDGSRFTTTFTWKKIK